MAIRSSSQAAVDSLAAAFASHDEDGRVDFMRLAICLAKEPPQAKPPPTPTLRPRDLFAFVHLEERSTGSGAEGRTEYQTVGAYIVADSSPLFERYEYGIHGIVQCEELDLIIEGANPMVRGAEGLFTSDHPVEQAFGHGLTHGFPNWDRYVMTVRLFRKQDGTLRSICVMKRGPIAEDGIDEKELKVFHARPYDGDCISETLASGTAQAAAALGATRRNEVGDNYFSATLWFEPVGLPSPEEGGWAGTLRNALRERALRIDWSDADREELSNIRSFKFRLSKLLWMLDMLIGIRPSQGSAQTTCCSFWRDLPGSNAFVLSIVHIETHNRLQPLNLTAISQVNDTLLSICRKAVASYVARGINVSNGV